MELPIYTIIQEDKFYVVKHFSKEISRKKSLIQATKALAAYQKGRE